MLYQFPIMRFTNLNLPTLKSLDGKIKIHFFHHTYYYIQLTLPMLSKTQQCFQVELSLSGMNGLIQFVYDANDISLNTSHRIGLYTTNFLKNKLEFVFVLALRR